MVDPELLSKIKRHTIAALVSDNILMGILVLKGGNALDIAYDISNRGSIDIDFSIEKDFTEAEQRRIMNQASSLLNKEFAKSDLVVFDVDFYPMPNEIDEAVKSFWGGYCLEFKIIPKEKFDALAHDVNELRKYAIPIAENTSPKFIVDISRYEYIAQKTKKDIDGAVVYVYTPEMLALEKLRALCQQISSYKEIVKRMTTKSRARDFYDIYNLTQSFAIDFKSEENIVLAKHIFEAKRVPLAYINKIAEYKEQHRQSWESVVATINQREGLKDFDFYFDFVLKTFKHLA